MKLITLNIWGGCVRDPLLQFIQTHSEVDVWCLQEVYHSAADKISTDDRDVSLDIYSDIQDILTDHKAFFRPTVQGIYGIASFVKKNIKVIEEGEVSIHHNHDYPGTGPAHSRNLQWLTCHHNDKTYSIMNLHALWNGQGKTDTPDRIAQSHKIKAFIDTVKTPKIVCGDFNLRPDTKSLHIIENGLNNLIAQYNVTSTRTSLYKKEEKFADYIFTSPELSVNDFKVLPDEVSDHSALLLDFECAPLVMPAKAGIQD
ncbi:MAG: endonuclease/exonuclease/phosphatase family protein [Legionellales bacterium]|nr:endonuclease/exonuclease/phosphatase family protein [Legionellales bacterium]